MPYSLIIRDVEASCKKLIDDHAQNCSGFIRAVAADLMIFIPGISGQADGQIEFQRLVGAPNGKALGTGQGAEAAALRWAADGHLVIAGMTSSELEANRPGRTVSHGHVAIVMDGKGATGWPLGYWGQLGGTPGKRESLSTCFRRADRAQLSYFGYRIAGVE